MPGETIVLKAINVHEDNIDGIRLYTHMTTLLIEIQMKQNMLVELYLENYNTSDGLVNGSDGVFKEFTKADNFDIVWIKFNDPNIGQQKKLKYACHYN